MRRWVYRLRWRLARWFATDPIMVDPFPGHKAIVIVREGGTTGSWALDELSVESTIDPVLRLHPGDFTNYVPARRTTTFTGKAVA